MAETVISILVKDFEKYLSTLAEAATSGGVKDWPTYQNLLGRVNGIERCLIRVKELEKTMMEGEDDDQ